VKVVVNFVSSLGARLLACESERRSESAQRRARAQQVAVARHEVGVSVDLGGGIELRDDGLEEGVLGCCVALALEFGDPERTAAASCVGLVDIVHECGGVAAVVPVNADEVDLAVSAGGEEVGEPGQAHGSAAVGDSWGAELGLACEGLDKFLEPSCSGGG